MEKLKIQLNEAILNDMNPRTITDTKFSKLIASILVLPKMLEMRPVVVDDNMIVLGGNMRLRALRAIADMSEDEVKTTLYKSNDFNKKTQAERDSLVDYWFAWKDRPMIEVIKASMLSAEEQKQFIIKDNVGFGAWDFDMLANEWDEDSLKDWGIDLTFNSNDFNLDDFFDEGGVEKGKEDEEKITITLKGEDISLKDEILDAISNALDQYPNITVK